MITTQQPNSPKNLDHENDSRRPLWMVLVIPFAIIIIVAVSSVNYLSYRNSQVVVDGIVAQLLGEINLRIQTHLQSFLETPQIINRSNANLIQDSGINHNDINEMGHYFWEEIQFYETVSSIYFGNPQGGLVSGGREGTDGSFYIIETDNFESGPLTKYATDSSGNQTDILVQVPQFDSLIRPWYIGAVEKTGLYWAEPYVLSTQQDLAIASSLAVHDDDNFVGVVSVDLFMTQINDFLQSMEIGKTGQTYIMEHSGLLIATSSGTATVFEKDTGDWERIFAYDSENPLIAKSSAYIANNLGGFSDFDGAISQSVQIDGENYYLWLSPFHRIQGLDWLVITIIPKEDFLGAISAHNYVTLFLTLLAVIGALAVAFLTAFYISRPITDLSRAATQLAQGKWSQTVPIKGVAEVRALGRAFNSMSTQLHSFFNELETRVQERTAELAKSETRYRGIVEDQTELICRFSPDYKLTFVNKAYCRYFGQAGEDLLNKSFMPRLPKKDRIYLKQKLAILSPAQPTIEVEHQIVTPNNGIRWMQWANRALFDESGQIIEIQAVGRDVTEQRQYKDTLEKALDRETELNKLKSDFITTVSHEFRTPMTIILNSSEIMERYGERLDADKKTRHFLRIKEQIQQMTYLLDEVLTLHQSETQNQGLKPQELDLVDLFQKIINDFEITGQNINFEFRFSEICKTIFADEKYLHLILSNLLSNAVKYSESGGKVEVHLDCDGKVMNLSVKDEGIGIPDAVQPHIFEPFYRANNVQTISGTGLGLSIVKKYVEQHHGTISFESIVGQGTTFTVQIPRVDSKESSNENDTDN